MLVLDLVVVDDDPMQWENQDTATPKCDLEKKESCMYTE